MSMTTAAGQRKFLNYMLYGVLKAASELGNAKVFMRAIEQKALGKFYAMEDVKAIRARDALGACRAYSGQIEAKGIMDVGDTSFQADGDSVLAHLGASCPYREACTWVHDEGDQVHCFRGVALAEMLRLTLKRDYRWSLDSFGLPCRLALKPQTLEVPRHGN